MQIDLTTKLGQWIADNGTPFASLVDSGRIYFDGQYPAYPGLGQTCRIYDGGIGEWYLFGGYCLTFGLIRADSLGSAFEIYLEEYIAPDDPADCADLFEGGIEEAIEYGTFDGCGNWYSEATTCYIVEMPLDRADAIIVDMVAD